jgi:hypothetical protein
MSAENGNPQAPPTPEEIAALKRLVEGVIRAQGNRFIKELLRAKEIRIGIRKRTSWSTSTVPLTMEN